MKTKGVSVNKSKIVGLLFWFFLVYVVGLVLVALKEI